MKTISLNEIGAILNPYEMKKVLGGGSYRCFCGMGSDANFFDVNADSCKDAVWGISWICPDGGGCFCDDKK